MSVTRLLILANVVVFGFEAFSGDALVRDFALWPLGSYASPELDAVVGFRPWQLVTSAFLHAGVAHIALNLLALWMFGAPVEERIGARRYATLYAAAVVTASLTQLVVVSTMPGPPFPTVGASGGVFGLLLAFGALFPRRVVMLLFPPIPMPARIFVVLYGAIELVEGVLDTRSGVAHFAHLGGMLGAWILLGRWRRRGLSAER